MIIVYFTSQSIYNKIGDSGVASLSEALKVNSSLIQLDLGMSLLLKRYYCFFLSQSICSNIGLSGALSLSEALEVNTSLSQLNLEMSLSLNMINRLLFNHIPLITR